MFRGGMARPVNLILMFRGGMARPINFTMSLAIFPKKMSFILHDKREKTLSVIISFIDRSV
jgi:hypothetical protein